MIPSRISLLLSRTDEPIQALLPLSHAVLDAVLLAWIVMSLLMAVQSWRPSQRQCLCGQGRSLNALQQLGNGNPKQIASLELELVNLRTTDE